MKVSTLHFFAAAVFASPVSIQIVNEAPVISSVTSQTIPNEYIVVFKEFVNRDKAEDHHAWVKALHVGSLLKRDQQVLNSKSFGAFGEDVSMIGGLNHIYENVVGFRGYSGRFSEDVLQELRNSPDIEYIEQDSVVHTLDLEKNAPWGLARLSHRDALGFSTFNKYEYDMRSGEGVTAYIIDTGINVHHLDFEGRASWGKTIPSGDEDEDGNGHGTHCAGTVASKTYGVAKKAKVVAVKVLKSNGSGTMSDVLKGVEWAAEAHIKAQAEAKKKNKPFKGSTANMSLGGGKSQALDRVVNAAVNAGLHFAVAAGNDNADACNYSPAAAENAITVGASTIGDERAYFSNHGKCTDIFAPGMQIKSTWTGGNNSINTISGTSMASPHICGLLTYALSLQPNTTSGYSVPITPAKMKQRMISLGSTGKLSDLPSHTVNVLAYNGFTETNKTANPWVIDATSRSIEPTTSDTDLSYLAGALYKEMQLEMKELVEEFEALLAEAKGVRQ